MRVAWICLLSAMTATAPAASSYSQTEQVLYSFQSARTGFPDGKLLRERSGALLGAASGYGYGAPYGQIFMLKKSGNSWKSNRLLAFDGQNGATPLGGLIEVSPGMYYGTTSKGGDYGGGTVFQLVHSGGQWAETILQSFQTGTGAMHPQGPVVLHKDAIYGTDAGGKGALFELRAHGRTWDQSVLHTFDGGDGRKPMSGLTRDPVTGVLYGTTLSGGSFGCGTAFALSTSSGRWKVKTIHEFRCGRDGANPQSGLTEDASGNLYGTTNAGGDIACGYNGSGCGTLFRLANGKSGWRHTILHTFIGSDGTHPEDHDGLAVDGSGTVYGTTSQGGAYNRGVAFEVSTSGDGFALLHSFGGAGDGEYPSGGVIEDERSGTLYGTTYSGGAYGYGAIYQIAQ